MARILIGNVWDIPGLSKHFAPAGYGLGGDAPIITDLDAQRYCGWYDFGEGSVGSPFQYGGALLVLSKGTTFVQLAFNIVSADWGGAGGIARRIGGAETWHEWEFINPPMMSGAEYKTVERWNGKPVYTTLVALGYPTGSPTTTVTKVAASFIVRSNGHMGGDALPIIDGDLNGANSAWANATVKDGYINISLYFGSGMSGKGAGLQVWYTKE